MHFKLYLYLFLFFLFIPKASFAQAPEELHYSETIVGLNLNTNAGIIGGLMTRYSWNLQDNHYHSIGLEIVNVKHPKELKYASPVTGNVFIGGKQNYLFAIRPSYGRNIVLFKKAPEEGVQIDAIFAIGPSIGIMKPYIIEYDYYTYSEFEPFDPYIHNDINRILGSGGMLNGFSLSKVTLGWHLKAGLSFEFGSFSHNISGIEAGVLIESYTKEIPIISYAHNQFLFSSFYINIFYGSRK